MVLELVDRYESANLKKESDKKRRNTAMVNLLFVRQLQNLKKRQI
jgi:hypothetical protein